MDKNILIRSLLQGLAGMILFALLFSIFKDDSFLDCLDEPYTVLCGITTFAGCYIGSLKRANKKA